MPVDYAENPSRFRGSGTVFIAREAGSLWGYWDALPDADPAALEQLPDGLTLIEAANGASNAPHEP